MPIIILLLVIIVLLLGGWWIFAVAIGAIVAAIAIALAAVIGFLKIAWPYLLGGFGLFLAFGIAGLFVQAKPKPTDASKSNAPDNPDKAPRG